MNENWLFVLFRWLCGALLCFFGYIPAWIFVQVVLTLIEKPDIFDLTALLVLFGTAALTYFFAIVAYRAFTGRGRKQDDGLLPRWAMVGFIHTFGVVACCIIIVGLFQKQLVPIVGGLGYLATAYGALLRYKKKRSWRRNSTPPLSPPACAGVATVASLSRLW